MWNPLSFLMRANKYDMLELEKAFMPAHILADHCFETVTYPVPEKNNVLDPFFIKHSHLKENIKQQVIYHMNRVAIYPGMSEIFYDERKKQAYISASKMIDLSYCSQEFTDFIKINYERTGIVINKIANVKSKRIMGAGIDLTGVCNNYWHVVVDILPRLVISNMSNIPIDIPFLISDTLHSNYVELVQLLADGREIVKLPAEQNGHFGKTLVESLYYPAPYYSYIFHPIYNIYSNPLVSRIDPRPLYYTMQLILKKLDIVPSPDPTVKLICKRNSSHRISPSQDELISFAMAHGYTIFEPEKLSMKEQIQLAASASVMVGFFGAALTNCLFMHKDARKYLIGSPGFYAVADFWNCMLSNATILKNDVVLGTANDGLHDVPELNPEQMSQVKRFISES